MSDSPNYTIRPLSQGDRTALRHLAERDTATTPALPALGAFVADELIAARSLQGSGAVADPFRATAEAVEILARRVRAMRGGGSETSGRLLPRLRELSAVRAGPSSGRPT